MVVFDGRSVAVPLGALLGEGGEGRVLEVSDGRDLVAKIYSSPIANEKAAKLQAMVRMRSDRLARISAWPLDTLHGQPGGPTIGFLMERVRDHLPIHMLYGPASRKTHFPSASWPFLIAAAANTARAFAAIHEQQHVVGDVNHGNLVVCDRATVMLIDTDSFQIRSEQKTYLCEVGVATHTPPELQGKPFSGVVRTADHDNFGLAVLIFQLLFMGRHPFAGAFLGQGDMPIEQAIAEHRFAYGPGAQTRQMRPPPGTLPISAVTPELAGLFEQAFCRTDSAASRPSAVQWVKALGSCSGGLAQCAGNPAHHYLKGSARCPWCTLEGMTGATFFMIVGPAPGEPGEAASDLATIWARILAIQPPGRGELPLPATVQLQPSRVPPALPPRPSPRIFQPPAPASPPPAPAPLSPAALRPLPGWCRLCTVGLPLSGLLVSLAGAATTPVIVGVAAGLTLIALLLFVFWDRWKHLNPAARIAVWAHRRELSKWEKEVRLAEEQHLRLARLRFAEEEQEALARYEQQRIEAEQQRALMLRDAQRRSAAASNELQALRQRWEQEMAQAGHPFDRLLSELKQKHDQAEALARGRAAKLLQLEQSAREQHRRRFLETFRIEAATIEGIGPGRKATLASYGIETAADCEERRLRTVPRFGDVLTGKLLSWRIRCEQGYRAPGSVAADPREVALLDRQLAQEKAMIARALVAGASRLESLRDAILGSREQLLATAGRLRGKIEQARADIEALSKP